MHREMADYKRDVGLRLKVLRKSRQASQEDAAHTAGVSTTTWRNWERGLRSPYESNWRKLARGFKLSDEEVAAIRGTPPDPLGLSADGQAGRVVSLLEQQNALLADVAGGLGDLMAVVEQARAEAAARATAKPSGRRRASGA